jgi:hypothetical protein
MNIRSPLEPIPPRGPQELVDRIDQLQSRFNAGLSLVERFTIPLLALAAFSLAAQTFIALRIPILEQITAGRGFQLGGALIALLAVGYMVFTVHRRRADVVRNEIMQLTLEMKRIAALKPNDPL